MRADSDLMVYVAARWPSLVKEAVRLGVPPDEAPATATEALARCRRSWARASREASVEALVHDELARAASRRPRPPEARRQQAAPGPPGASREQAARELLVLAPPDLDDLKRQESENDRRVLKRGGIIAVALLLVAAGAGFYLATDGGGSGPDDSDALPTVDVTREENPTPGVVWYADGRLHLDHVVLAIHGLRDMTKIGDGVVYGDDDGRVVYAADDGSRQVLGHKDPAFPVVATDETGRAAWVDPGGTPPTLVVKEVTTGNPVRSFSVDAGARAVAVDGNAIYYSDAEGAHVVPSPSRDIVPYGPARLLDVRSRIRAPQVSQDSIEVAQPVFDASFDVPGRGALLAPDGIFVATRDPDTGQVTLYDDRSGKRLTSGLADGDEVVALSPAARLTIAYVVRPAGA